jgi:hypothetical protein
LFLRATKPFTLVLFQTYSLYPVNHSLIFLVLFLFLFPLLSLSLSHTHKQTLIQANTQTYSHLYVEPLKLFEYAHTYTPPPFTIMSSAFDNFWARQHPSTLFAEPDVTEGIYQARACAMAYKVVQAWAVSSQA